MSRHSTVMMVGGTVASVVMGYDRRCAQFFLEVKISWVDEVEKDVRIYGLSADRRLRVRGRPIVGGLTAAELYERLDELCLGVPKPMLETVLEVEQGVTALARSLKNGALLPTRLVYGLLCSAVPTRLPTDRSFLPTLSRPRQAQESRNTATVWPGDSAMFVRLHDC
jgi:hypothetical protein